MGLPRIPRKLAVSGQGWLIIFLLGVIVLLMTFWAVIIAGSLGRGSELGLFVIFWMAVLAVRIVIFALLFSPVFLAAAMILIGYRALFKKKSKLNNENQTP